MTVDIATTYRVYYRADWSAAWVYDENLYPTGVIEQLVAPDYGSATILRDIGQIKRETWTDFFQVLPVSLVGYYIWIEANYNGNSWTAFIGVITDQTDNLMDDVTVSGYQTFTAREIGFVLDRREIRNSAVVRSGSRRFVDRVYTFNEMPEIGTKIRGNKSLLLGPENSFIFDDNPLFRNFVSDLVTWNARDAAAYLLTYLAPTAWGITFQGQVNALDDIKDTWSLEGQTCWSAVCAIIHRRYGVGFHLTYSPATNAVAVNIWTTTDIPIVFGSATIPANAFQTTFTIPPVFPFNHVIDVIQMRLSSTTAYRSILVRGNFVKSTATYSFANTSLKEGWASSAETAYLNPGGEDAEEKDQRRSQENYEAVFSRFVVPRSFQGSVNNYNGVGAAWAVFPQTLANASPNPNAIGGFSFMGKKFERDLPFKKGWRYDVNPPVNNNDFDANDEYQPIMAWIYDSFDGDEHAKTDRFIPLDRIHEVLPEVNISLTAAPLAKQMGFEIKCSPNHLLAGDNFLPEDESRRYPEFDYRQLVFTATVQCDERIKVSTTISTGPPGSELVIDVPDMECWYVHPNTVVDVGDDGSLLTYVGPQLIRDDTPKMRGILAAAKAWYGQIRQAIAIPLKRVDFWVGLGSYLTGITGQSLSVPVRAPVTAKRINVESNSMTVETGWLAKDYGPDFSRATGVVGKRSRRVRNRR